MTGSLHPVPGANKTTAVQSEPPLPSSISKDYLVHLLVAESQCILAFSQAACVLGAANAGATPKAMTRLSARTETIAFMEVSSGLRVTMQENQCNTSGYGSSYATDCRDRSGVLPQVGDL